MSGIKEVWSSRLGVILAVAGSAVGLGNFLRFPGLAAQYGSGAFMLAYFISLLIIGIPICWVEWTLGRYAGQKGFHSSPGIFYCLIRHPAGKYLGVLGAIIPVGIYMYYVYIEAWCAMDNVEQPKTHYENKSKSVRLVHSCSVPALAGHYRLQKAGWRYD